MSSITLYGAKVCPWSHRVQMALTEANAQFKVYWIDLWDKPEWFPRVNPKSGVPVIAYGGPHVPPEDPSPDSVKLAESLVLIEFVADLFPEANLLPMDPVFRAKARFFNEVVSSKFVPAYIKFLVRGEGYEDILTAVEAIQDILPDNGKYAVGEQYTIADVAITPFIARLRLTASNELGGFPVGQGSECLKVLGSEKYAKFHVYAEHLLERPSFQTTFDVEPVKDYYQTWFARGK